jgi:hypothetical protein
VQLKPRQLGALPFRSMEGLMSSAASLITLLASVVFALIVIAVIVRLGPAN